MGIKIFVDLRTLGWTGIGRVAAGILNCIEKMQSQYDITLIVDKDFDNNKNYKIITFNSKPFGFLEQYEFLKLIRNNPGEIILHSTYFNIPIIKPRRVKLIVNFYDVLKGTKEFKTIFHKLFYFLYVERISKFNSVILCQSEFTINAIRRHHKFNNLIYAPPGFNSYLTKNIKNVNLEKIFGINSEYILYVGLNKPRKNLKGLLDAFREFLVLHPGKDIQLCVAGPLTGKLAYGFDIASEVNGDKILAKHVKLLGFVSDEYLASLYENARLYVVPSHLESGYSYPALEALSFGTPVLLNYQDMYEFSTEGVEFFNYQGKSLGSALNESLLRDAYRVNTKNSSIFKKLTWDNYELILRNFYV